MPATGHTCLTFAGDDRFAELYGLGAVALRYLMWGYAVIPLAPGLKRPHHMLDAAYSPGARGGIYHATNSADQVMAWWSQDRAANIGIATGSRSALVVVDLDIKRGDDGPGNFARHIGHPASLPPEVPTVETPSGGRHLWLRLPPGATIGERPGILPGVDIKGEGGLVAAPPSMQAITPRAGYGEVTGPVPVPYEWAEGCPCSAPQAPDWLLPWAHGAASLGSTTAAEDFGDLADLNELAKNGIPVGRRNAALYRVACGRFRKHGTGSEGWANVDADLRRVLKATDRHDFTNGEVRTIMASAQRFVMGYAEAEDAQMRSWEQRARS